jgi:hypothetical protein
VSRVRARIGRELVFLALGAMESFVIAPLLAAFLSLLMPVNLLQITGACLGAILAVHYLARALLRSSMHSALRAGLLGLGMLVSGLLVVHQLRHAQTGLFDPTWLAAIFRDLRQAILSHDVIAFLAVLFLWWRGLLLAQQRLESDTVVSRFRMGLVMLAITTMVSGFILPAPPYQFVFAYFFVSLLGIALARAEEVGQQYGGSRSPFALGWLAILVAASLIVLLLAAGVATLLTGENVSLLVEPMWMALRDVLTVLAYGLVTVGAWLVRVLLTIVQDVFELDLSRLGRLLAPPPGPELPAEPGEPMFAPEQLALARAVGVIGGVLLVVAGVALSLRRLRARAERRRDEERESVWEGAHLGQGLRDLLRQGRRRVDEAAAALARSRLGRLFAALTIRRIYAHANGLAAERGYPRAPYQTPYEYLPALELAFPDNREDLVRITEAYVAVHYGEVLERPQDLATVEAAWASIRGGGG